MGLEALYAYHEETRPIKLNRCVYMNIDFAGHTWSAAK